MGTGTGNYTLGAMLCAGVVDSASRRAGTVPKTVLCAHVQR